MMLSGIGMPAPVAAGHLHAVRGGGGGLVVHRAVFVQIPSRSRVVRRSNRINFVLLHSLDMVGEK